MSGIPMSLRGHNPLKHKEDYIKDTGAQSQKRIRNRRIRPGDGGSKGQLSDLIGRGERI